ncbi:hypothetical protein A4X13_0g7327 [Tilletia indica]|uniref:Uncharacterized protein n=1 Tax=Tilletia indica TaxID=43049 RepID=A0A177TAL4_9BASI|nr:hypothetical protein A4X13_0g7327 [Tilletia indica]
MFWDSEADYGRDDYGYPEECPGSPIPNDEVSVGGACPVGPPCGPKDGPVHDLGILLGQAVLSFSGKAECLPSLPGLFIEGIGHVALPILSSFQAEAIAQVASPKDQTRSDAFEEVEASKVRFENPEWQRGVNRTIEMATSRLGLPHTTLSAQLCGLKLFRRSNTPTRQQGRREHPNHFCTLIIQLPSLREGGNVLVHKLDNKSPKVYSLGDDEEKSARYGCSFALRDAEADFSITPIKHGYSLFLEYAVLWPNSASESTPIPRLNSTLKANVAQVLSRIAQEKQIIVQLLGQVYEGEESISQTNLKAKDLNLISILQEASDAMGAAGYVFYLAKARRGITYVADGRSFAEAKWETEPFQDEKNFDGLYMLDGTAVVSSSYHFNTLNRELDENKVLNPDAKSWDGAWHGYMLTSYHHDDEVGKTNSFYKYALVGWPKQDDSWKLFQICDEVESFRKLNADSATPASVSQFLQLWARKSKSSPATISLFPRYQFRQRLFKVLVARLDLHHLVRPFLDICSRPLEFVGEEYGGKHGHDAEEWTVTGIQTLLDLISTEALWDNHQIRSRISTLFSGRKGDITHLLQTCFDTKVDAWKWKLFFDLLVKAMTNPRPRKSIFPTHYEKDIFRTHAEQDDQWWRLAVESSDSALCQTLINEQMKADKSLLERSVKTLRTLQQRYPLVFETKRDIVKPLAQACEEMLLKSLRELPPGVADFRKPTATFHADRAVEKFLRGPDQYFTVRKFDSITQARAFIKNHGDILEAYSCTVVVADGNGRYPHVQITKIGTPAGEVKQRKAELESALGEARQLMTAAPPLKDPRAPWDTPELRFHLALTKPSDPNDGPVVKRQRMG